MAKNKAKTKKTDDEYIDQDEVIYEEEVGSKEGHPRGEHKVSFLKKNQNVLIGGGVAILAVIMFFVIQNRNRDSSNLEAQTEMINPTLYYEQDSFRLALVGDGQQFQGFEALEGDYSGTTAGNLMKYYIGTAYLKMGQIDPAIEYLEGYKKHSDVLSAAALGALGSAYEQKNIFDKAAESFEEASSTPEENDFSTPYYLMQAARNYESAGDKEAALEIYKRIRKDYPLSQQAAEGNIDKYIARLSPDDIDG
jgi:tetratricopeptide (TPR) repeat protein